MQILNFFKLRNHCYNFLFLIFLNKLFVESINISFPLKTLKNEEDLKPLYINYEELKKEEISKCKYLIPSLLLPFLMVNKQFSVKNIEDLGVKVNIYSPILNESFASLFHFKLFDQYNVTLSKELSSSSSNINVEECFFGLSKLGNFSNLNENKNIINLIKLTMNHIITNPIFSFDKWDLKDNDEITSKLFIGDEHNIFNSSDGIVGTCNIDKNDSFWGCTFKEMNFNDNIIRLTDSDGSFYKIYFSSESHKIIFPESFRVNFNESTNNICYEDSTDGLLCPNLFKNSKDYITIKLIDENMIITTEIDNLKRFNSNNEGNHKTRITFENINYFVFPLIMFKNFYVQFDLNKNIISFFTTDNSILELITNEKKQEDSNVGKVFLIIFIILLIIALGFGLFWFIKKRRSSVEKNVNKYNKFEEDDEVLKNMNEKRVF